MKNATTAAQDRRQEVLEIVRATLARVESEGMSWVGGKIPHADFWGLDETITAADVEKMQADLRRALAFVEATTVDFWEKNDRWLYSWQPIPHKALARLGVIWGDEWHEGVHTGGRNSEYFGEWLRDE